jgi:hypothetical protein
MGTQNMQPIWYDQNERKASKVPNKGSEAMRVAYRENGLSKHRVRSKIACLTRKSYRITLGLLLGAGGGGCLFAENVFLEPCGVPLHFGATVLHGA